MTCDDDHVQVASQQQQREVAKSLEKKERESKAATGVRRSEDAMKDDAEKKRKEEEGREIAYALATMGMEEDQRVSGRACVGASGTNGSIPRVNDLGSQLQSVNSLWAFFKESPGVFLNKWKKAWLECTNNGVADPRFMNYFLHDDGEHKPVLEVVIPEPYFVTMILSCESQSILSIVYRDPHQEEGGEEVVNLPTGVIPLKVFRSSSTSLSQSQSASFPFLFPPEAASTNSFSVMVKFICSCVLIFIRIFMYYYHLCIILYSCLFVKGQPSRSLILQFCEYPNFVK